MNKETDAALLKGMTMTIDLPIKHGDYYLKRDMAEYYYKMLKEYNKKST